VRHGGVRHGVAGRGKVRSLREIGKKFNVAHTTIMAWKEKYSEGKIT